MQEVVKRTPNSYESEVYVLGCILLDASIVPEVISKLTPADFYYEQHRNVIIAVRNLYDNNKTIDVATVAEELKRLNLFETVGGNKYLFELLDSVPSTANVSVYIDIIKEKALERELLNVTREIADDILTGKYNFSELLDTSEKKINQVLNKRQTSSFLKIDLAADKVFDIIETTKGTEHNVTGLDTGFKKLNELTFGLQKGELIIIAARPGVGKSAFALNLATNACRMAKAHVAFFSLEMSIDQLVIRLFSSLSGVSLTKIRSSKLNKTEMAMLLTAKQELSKFNLYLDESNTTDLSEIRAKCKKLKRESGLDLVIVDYLQLLNVTNSRGNRTEEVGQISRGLKVLARELDVPVVALSQLSRAVESRQDKRPILADLRESGSIEQDADIVIFLSRETPKDGESRKTYGSKTEIIIAKNRQGMTDSFHLIFRGSHSSFVDQEETNLQTTNVKE